MWIFLYLDSCMSVLTFPCRFQLPMVVYLLDISVSTLFLSSALHVFGEMPKIVNQPQKAPIFIPCLHQASCSLPMPSPFQSKPISSSFHICVSMPYKTLSTYMSSYPPLSTSNSYACLIFSYASYVQIPFNMSHFFLTKSSHSNLYVP